MSEWIRVVTFNATSEGMPRSCSRSASRMARLLKSTPLVSRSQATAPRASWPSHSASRVRRRCRPERPCLAMNPPEGVVRDSVEELEVLLERYGLSVTDESLERGTTASPFSSHAETVSLHSVSLHRLNQRTPVHALSRSSTGLCLRLG